MKNVLHIVNTKPSDLEFDVNVDGFEPKSIDVCLCIKTKDYYLKFPCKKSKSNWECHIPALQHLEKGAYPYVIEVVADGYHFNAMEGTANISGTFDIYAKKPDKLAPGTVEKKEKTEPKKEPKKVTKESNKETTPIKKVANKSEPKKETVDLSDKKFTSMIDGILNKKDSTPPTKKKEEPLTENNNSEESSSKVDVIKKIVSETKGTKTKIPTIPMRKVEKKVDPIIKKEEKVLEENADPSNEKDDNVKDILKNLSTKKVQEEKSSRLFKKGKRIVH